MKILKVHVSRQYRLMAEPVDQQNFGTIVIADLIAAAATFPSLPIAIAALTTINNNYLIKINAAKGGDHDAIVARDKYRDETWIPAFDKTADYVEQVAAHDP